MKETPRYTIDDLLYLMDRLRHPDDGCPWDRKQVFASIVPHTIEELYEVIDAIEREDWPHLREELGDLLFQVVFYAQLGKEQELFDFAGVIDGIVTKLLRRHPHVFPDGTLASRMPPGSQVSEEEIRSNWQRIKTLEKLEKKALEVGAVTAVENSLFAGIPAALPALQKAEQLQKKAAAVGFDWPSLEPVFAKIREELDELEAELDGSGHQPEGLQDRLEDEMGDVLFCCLNLARFLGVSGDAALRSANRKFLRRFGFIEQALQERGLTPAQVDLQTMDGLWDEAKRQGL